MLVDLLQMNKLEIIILISKEILKQMVTKRTRDKHHQLLLNLQNIVLEVTRLQNLV